MSNRVNQEGIMLFEQPFTKVSRIHAVTTKGELIVWSMNPGAIRELPEDIPHISKEP